MQGTPQVSRARGKIPDSTIQKILLVKLSLICSITLVSRAELYMLRLNPDTMVIIESDPDGCFTFQVKFRGVLGPKSRPMSSRDDVELLGNTLLKHLERNSEQWMALAHM
jgi:hypothetical protein